MSPATWLAVSALLCSAGCLGSSSSGRTPAAGSGKVGYGLGSAGSILADLPRPPPVVDFAVKRTVLVADAGAIPDDGQDDLPALRLALAEALSRPGPVRLEFAPGRYDLVPSEPQQPALRITGAERLIVEGRGAEIVLHNPSAGFIRVASSRDVIIRDLSVDYDPLPFSQTIVRGVSPGLGTVIVEVQPGFAPLDAPYFQESARWNWPLMGPVSTGLLKDLRHLARLKSNVPNTIGVSKVEHIEGRRFRLVVGPVQALFFSVGDHFVHLARGGPAVLEAKDSEQVTFQRITTFAGPGTAYLSGASRLVNLLSVRIMPRGNRWQSTDADGIIVYRNRVGPWIEDSLFEGIGDDGININTPPALAVSKRDDSTFVLRGRANHLGNQLPYEVKAGDRLRVYGPDRGSLLGDTRVDSARPGPDGTWTVRVTPPLPLVQPGETDSAPIFYNDDTSGGGFVIRRNRFQNTRRYGVVVQGHHGIIDDNVFIGTSGNAISVINTIHSGSGFAAHHVQVRRNRFEDCYLQRVLPRGEAHAAIVATALERNDYRLAEWRGISDVTFEGNVFLNWGQVPALKIANGERIVVRGNTFSNALPRAPLQRPPPAIAVINSEQVTNEGNEIEDVRLQPKD